MFLAITTNETKGPKIDQNLCPVQLHISGNPDFPYPQTVFPLKLFCFQSVKFVMEFIPLLTAKISNIVTHRQPCHGSVYLLNSSHHQ